MCSYSGSSLQRVSKYIHPQFESKIILFFLNTLFRICTHFRVFINLRIMEQEVTILLRKQWTIGLRLEPLLGTSSPPFSRS